MLDSDVYKPKKSCKVWLGLHRQRCWLVTGHNCPFFSPETRHELISSNWPMRYYKCDTMSASRGGGRESTKEILRWFRKRTVTSVNNGALSNNSGKKLGRQLLSVMYYKLISSRCKDTSALCLFLKMETWAL